jgi:uncharacterized protein YndB with AHSA1/START domain
MSVNEIHIEATPERVFEVLADASSYEDWVVGASDIRDVQGAWPQEGATFHHTQFVPRVGLKDTTSVLEERRPGYICLCVRARPLVVGKVEMKMEARNGGTRTEMVETPVGGLLGKIHNPLFDVGLKLRNAESLRRLKKLAES